MHAITLCLMLAAGLAAAGAAPSETALLEAAQRGDVVQVRSLLDAGTPVDARSRYGATALFFAADKANLELARLLLDRGADVNVVDTFYNASPLPWALFKGATSAPHRELARLLVERGAADPGAALSPAVSAGDKALVQAVLATGKAKPDEIGAAFAQANKEGQSDIAALLALLAPPPSAGLPADEMARLAGEYKAADIGLAIMVSIEAGELRAQATGQPAFTLDPTPEGTLKAREFGGIELRFADGQPAERFTLLQGGRETVFVRAQPAAAAAAPATLPPIPAATRSAARPWPSFRGPAASGIGDGQGAPAAWDGEKGQNVRWKTAVPGLALSSPVIWDGKVFVTSAVAPTADRTFRTGLYGDVDSVPEDALHTWTVFALELATGKILWQREAASGKPKVKRHLKSSHANPTPATDGQRLIVHFPSEGLFAYDLAGKLLWKQDLGVLGSGWFFDPTYEWGFSSSPILHDGKVIVQADVYQGSFLAAFDAATGKPLWRTERQEIPTWGTPAVIDAGEGKAEIVTNGTKVRGYDAATGAELWTLGPNSEITVATPVIANGLAYVTGGYPPARPVYAIKPGGRGDLSLAEGSTAGPHVPWSAPRDGTYIPTPIVYQGILYTLNNNGRFAAYDALTGTVHYRERIGNAGASFSGSPVAADGRLFLTSEDGTTFVLRAGPVFELLGTNPLGEVVMSSAAISDGVFVLRGLEHVWGLGEPPAPAPAR